jgi:hypothetical protein
MMNASLTRTRDSEAEPLTWPGPSRWGLGQSRCLSRAPGQSVIGCRRAGANAAQAMSRDLKFFIVLPYWADFTRRQRPGGSPWPNGPTAVRFKFCQGCRVRGWPQCQSAPEPMTRKGKSFRLVTGRDNPCQLHPTIRLGGCRVTDLEAQAASGRAAGQARSLAQDPMH